MLLENKYYKLISQHSDNQSVIFHLMLLPNCEVYRGHFPGYPVCPGVCGIEMVKECAMLLTRHKLRIGTIHKCRFTAVASPDKNIEQTIRITVVPDGKGYMVEARLYDVERVYMDYKGKMEII